MLTPKEKNALKAKAHALKPVVMIGAKGLTEAVIAESEEAIKAHELIKVKIASAEKGIREETAAVLIDALDAELVTMIGRIAIIYKERIED